MEDKSFNQVYKECRKSLNPGAIQVLDMIGFFLQAVCLFWLSFYYLGKTKNFNRGMIFLWILDVVLKITQLVTKMLGMKVKALSWAISISYCLTFIAYCVFMMRLWKIPIYLKAV